MTLYVNITLEPGDGPSCISFEAPRGRLVVVVGPNGAGKTTLLRTLIGLQSPASGSIRMDDTVWSRDGETLVSPRTRRFGWLPQRPSILATASVSDNLALAARGRGLSPSQARDAVARQVDRLELSSLLARRVGDLSGGELARVCLGRTLAGKPARLALDEPLSAIDRAAQAGIVEHLRESARTLEGPHLVVTHQPQAFASMDPLVVDLTGTASPTNNRGL